MAWLAFRDRLSTGDRMRSWGIEQCCMFCGEKNETRDHLFFACPYSFTVWTNTAKRLLGGAITPDRTDTVASLMLPARTRHDHVLKMMVFQTVFYSVWKERNSRRHGGVWVTTEKITRTIDKQIRNRISSLRYVKNHPLEGLMRRWFEVS
ncbi:PREDICTED: uncharacterized protein LOC106345022 [Brassica oleracea var. oleracea]|uniref:uncharacterized protein LOC106345022 n=1 Tax=Brassica oleracea var. oleracea TaxID=109376 RepID=UPI0006A6CA65|nr:PREDICTED: uncharacterized protein LOC106345022 [Brassica oleracea var. oleracea]